jgi:hypothetical protein
MLFYEMAVENVPVRTYLTLCSIFDLKLCEVFYGICKAR